MDIFISIIICCYNSEKYLLETLNSIKNQTYNNFEIIIINDGSSDSTEEIILDFKSKESELDINYFSNSNAGLASSRNYAILKSKYDWIALIDHDDLWSKTKLEVQVNEIKLNNDSQLFFSDFNIKQNEKILYSRFQISKDKDNFNPKNLNLSNKNAFFNLIKYGCFIGSSTVIFNKKVFKKAKYFNSKYKFICDYIFFLDVSYNFDIYCSNHILSYWRSHDQQATFKMKKIYYNEMFNFYFDNYFNNRLNMKVKINILFMHVRLILSYYFKK
tara:strand:- start:2639 stop:3457 length:819 start_codon:yes stop_codon:yes gene_type:complete